MSKPVVELRDGVDVGALALGLRADASARARPRRAPTAAARAGRMPTPNGLPQRLNAMPHSRHRARRIGLERRGKGVDRAPELERVQQRHRAVDVRLAAGVQDVAKATVPSFSVAAPPCSCSCATDIRAVATIDNVNARAIGRISAAPFTRSRNA